MPFRRQVFDRLRVYCGATATLWVCSATGAPASSFDAYFPRGQYPALIDVAPEAPPSSPRESLLGDIKVLSSEIQKSVREVSQKRNLTCFGDPCLFQAFPLLYSKPNSGFFGGFRANLTNISRRDPYFYVINTQVTRSDTQQWLATVNMDVPQVRLGPLEPRFKLRGSYARSTEFRYVGEGRASYDLNKYPDGDKRYSLRETAAGGTVLAPLVVRPASKFGLFATYDYSSVRTDPFGRDTLLYRLRPEHFRGGTFRSVGVGLYRDARPTETFTRNGEMIEAGVSTGRLDASGEVSYRVTVVDRRYQSVRRWTLAHRLTADGIFGASPFWVRSGVGGIDPVRDVSGSGILKAYSGGRFHEKYKLIESAELRLHQNEFRALGLRGDLAIMPLGFDVGFLNRLFAWSVATGFDVLWNRSFLTRFYAAFTETEWALRLKFSQEF